MDLNHLHTELQRLTTLVEGWISANEVSVLERDLVLARLRDLYEELRFADKAAAPQPVVAPMAPVDSEPIAEEEFDALDADNFLSLDELFQEEPMPNTEPTDSEPTDEEESDEPEVEVELIFADDEEDLLSDLLSDEGDAPSVEEEPADEPAEEDAEETAGETAEEAAEEQPTEEQPADEELLDEELPVEITIEATPDEEPMAEPEPVVEPEPIVEPEPVVEPEPIVEPEPVVEPEPIEEPKPIVEPAPEEEERPTPAESEKKTLSLFGEDEMVQSRHTHRQRVIMSLYDAPEFDEPYAKPIKQVVPSRSQITEVEADPEVVAVLGDDAEVLYERQEVVVEEMPVESVELVVEEPAEEPTIDRVESKEEAEAPIEQPQTEEKPQPVSEQPKRLGESLQPRQTLADQLASRQTTSVHHPVTDLRRAVSLNDKLLLIRELFKGNGALYEITIRKLNEFKSLDDCLIYIAEHFAWNPNSEGTKLMMDLLERKFK